MTYVATPYKMRKYWHLSTFTPDHEHHPAQQPNSDGADKEKLSTESPLLSSCTCQECPVCSAEPRHNSRHGSGISNALRTLRECMKIAARLIFAQLPRYRIDLRGFPRDPADYERDMSDATIVLGTTDGQDKSTLETISGSGSVLATLQKSLIMLVTPIPLLIVGSYGMNHVRRVKLSEAGQEQKAYELLSLVSIPDALGFVKNPDGMIFFGAGIAAAFLLTLLWLQRRHANRHRMVTSAFILAPALIALVTGLDILVSLLCILPWTMYATIALSDIAQGWPDRCYWRAGRKAFELVEDPKRDAIRSEVSEVTVV